MLKSMRLGTKILASFALALALTLVVGAVGYVTELDVTGHLNDLGDAKVPSLDALWVVKEAQTDAGRSLAVLMLRRADASLRQAAKADFEAAQRRMEEGARRYEALPHHPETLALWKDAQAKVGLWRKAAELAVGLVGLDGSTSADADAKAWAAFLEARKLRGSAVEGLQQAIEKTQQDALQSAEEGHSASRTGVLLQAVAILGGLGLLLVLGVVLSRSIGRTVRTLRAEAGKLREAVAAGKLDVRGEVAALAPEFRPIVEGMNETMDAFARPIEVTADYVARISRGDVPPPITAHYEGDFNRIKEALNRCIGSVSGLIGEMTRMSAEHERGEIDAAVDLSRFEGAWRTMAQGVNDMVGAHLAVKRKAMAVFAEFGKGNFDATIELLPGKKRFINDAIEEVRRNLKELVAELNRMSAEHDRGDIDARIEVQRFRGEFACVAQGVNDMVGGHIAVKKKAMACVAEFGRGNFEAPLERFPGKKAFINDTIEQVRERLKALIADADGLVTAAVAGQLSTRADAAKHQGDFRKIVDGVNRTLDAVLAPIQEAAQVLEGLSRRDLRARIQGSYQGDHARIKEAVNATGEALHDALSQVASAVDQVSSAATQIASSSQAVAAGASEQAASLEETSSSVESVAEQTKQSTDNAQQANVLAKGARAAATDGAAAVELLQASMGKIKQSAEGTSQIIKDVSDIAFQTNLLALNAAVEAARAGEAGRGFAVVAEEVRSLALRAKEAASKTEELIRQSVKQAVEGEVAAKQVAGKLSEIVGGVTRVTDIVAEIATASGAQASGITQVNQAIAEMDKVTQQNAASAEESSSAASELSGQAEELAAMVATFQLQGHAGAATPRASTHGPRALAAAAARLQVPEHGGGRPGVPRGVRNDDAPRAPATPGRARGAAPAADPFPMDQSAALTDF
jgi:methyl-accepting chemotaxis protein